MADARDIENGASARPHTQPGTYFDIYYQNIRGLRTKKFEI
jgi:hypothetical protein